MVFMISIFFKNIRNAFYAISVIAFIVCVSAQTYPDMERSSPFEKQLAPLEKPNPTNINKLDILPETSNDKVEAELYSQKDKAYIYKPSKAFKLVVTAAEYPNVLPDKGIYGVISLKVDPGYEATSRIIYQLKPYKFDRLSWAMKTAWNDTVPFFSRIKSFQNHLKPFHYPVYAHFYIMGVREYPEYPGQYSYWPKEALEDYYFYILKKIDALAVEEES